MSHPSLALLTLMSFRSLQCEAMEGEAYDDVLHLQPFGFHSVPEPGSQLVLTPLNGGRSLAVSTCVDDSERYAALIQSHTVEDGEVMIYSKGGNAIILRNTGDIEMIAPSAISINTPTATFSGAIVASAATIGGVDFASHTHGGVQTGGGETGGVFGA